MQQLHAPELASQLHGRLLRHIAVATGKHFQGLEQAGRHCRAFLSTKQRRWFTNLEATVHVNRHIDPVVCDDFFQQVVAAIPIQLMQETFVKEVPQSQYKVIPQVAEKVVNVSSDLISETALPKVMTQAREALQVVPQVLLEEQSVQVPQTQVSEVVKQVPKEQELVAQSEIPKNYTQVAEKDVNVPCGSIGSRHDVPDDAMKKLKQAHEALKKEMAAHNGSIDPKLMVADIKIKKVIAKLRDEMPGKHASHQDIMKQIMIPQVKVDARGALTGICDLSKLSVHEYALHSEDSWWQCELCHTLNWYDRMSCRYCG